MALVARDGKVSFRVLKREVWKDLGNGWPGTSRTIISSQCRNNRLFPTTQSCRFTSPKAILIAKFVQQS